MTDLDVADNAPLEKPRDSNSPAPLIDTSVALIVCAGPSLDRISPIGWEAVQRAGAVVSINEALVAQACRRHAVRFTYVAGMDIRSGLLDKLPGYYEAWQTTPAWRISAPGKQEVYPESCLNQTEFWSDDPNEGFKGGSTAMVMGNWLCNPWSQAPEDVAAREAASRRSGKAIPPRGFRKLAYLGLDMIPGQGAHAIGAGTHLSGFSDSVKRDGVVRQGWREVVEEAARRGIEVVNLSPGTGLKEVPNPEIPSDWLLAGDP